MLSMYDNERSLFEALKAGAPGYVLKSGADDIVDACRAAMRGQSFLYPSAVSALVRDFLDRADKAGDYDPLTPRDPWRPLPDSVAAADTGRNAPVPA